MRYLKNQPLISREKQELLSKKKIVVLGLGGLGGYLAHGALRLGIGKLHLIDGDVFHESNLNRQLFCTEKSIGQAKVEIVKKALLAINSKAEISTQKIFLEDVEESREFSDVDCLMDGLDNIPARYLLSKISRIHQIPLIHGAIDGFTGQYAFLEPDKDRMKKIYGSSTPYQGKSNLAFVASLIASYQLLLMTQYFLDDPELSKNQLIRLDLREQETTVIQL